MIRLHMLDELFPRIDARGRELTEPATDILELEDAYLAISDMPGLKAENIHLEFNGGKLRVMAEPDLNLPQGMNTDCLEFSRTLYLLELQPPSDCDIETMNAVYRDGVLTLHLPKKNAVLGSRIPVRMG